jgi:hypothetical protein
VRGVNLPGHGSNEEKLAAIEEYRRTQPDALMVFVADHISIPPRRLQKQPPDKWIPCIRDTLGRTADRGTGAGGRASGALITDYCTGRGVRSMLTARELVGCPGRRHDDDPNELEKLTSTSARKSALPCKATLGMVLAAAVPLYELTPSEQTACAH